MATIKDVAQRANVSIATVSYVLNGTGAVGEETRRAVIAAVEALQYRPSYRGRALQARRSMAIGIVVPRVQRMTEPSFGALLAGLTEGAAQNGYHLLLTTADGSEAEVYGPLWRSGRIDGIVILDLEHDDQRITAAQEENVPFICAGRPSDDRIGFVALDGAAGMVEAMAHLIVRGHERIGLLQPPLELTLADDQEAGYREALGEAAIAFADELVVEGGSSEAEGYAAVDDLLALPEPPTAIIAGTGALAFGAMHAINDAGRRVGHEIALISFEDTPAAAHTAPPLTAVRQPLRAWGRALAGGLVEVIGSATVPQIVVAPQLIVRRSCGE